MMPYNLTQFDTFSLDTVFLSAAQTEGCQMITLSDDHVVRFDANQHWLLRKSCC